MMEKTLAAPAAAGPALVTCPATEPAAGQGEVQEDRARPLFAPRPRRLATGPAPAAFIALVWVLLWAWVSLGVAAPLSRLGSQARPPAQQTSLRA